MVYCRTLPDLTFPVTEWDLGTRLVTDLKKKKKKRLDRATYFSPSHKIEASGTTILLGPLSR